MVSELLIPLAACFSKFITLSVTLSRSIVLGRSVSQVPSLLRAAPGG